MRAARLWVALGLALASPAAAQTPDSTAVPPTGPTVASPPAPSDAVRATPLAAPQPPPLGRAATPVLAPTGDLATEAGLDARPHAFGYALGAPGRWAGVSLWGLAPAAASLTLDGRDASDLYTGAPRLDLVPAEATGPLRLGGGTLGAPAALSAEVRPFRLGRPITELRYLSGHEGVQFAAASHAQTRRASALTRRLLGDAARTTLTAHAATRNADAQTVGGQLRHSHALGRLVASGRRRALELGGLLVDHGVGARRGVTGPGPAATVVGGAAARRTLKTEAWATLRAPLLAASPLAVTASWTGQRLRASPDGQDTLASSANRYALSLAQAARLDGHRLHVRATLAAAGDPSGGTDPFGDADDALGAHLVVADSVALGRAVLVVTPGVHAVGGAVWPSAEARLAAGPLAAGLARGARAPSLLARRGLAGPGLPVVPDPDDGLETTTRGDATLALRGGVLGLDLSAWGAHVAGVQRLVARGDTAFAAVRLGELVSVGGAAGLSARADARRGLYARATVALAQTLGADGDLARREADALPAARARLRFGARATGIGDVLDVDAGVTGRAWTAFRSRIVEPTTGALALPDPTTALGQELPARGTLGLDLTATFAGRAVVFLRYDHALGGRLYDGAALTQGEPLADTAFRFGIFWALLD